MRMTIVANGCTNPCMNFQPYGFTLSNSRPALSMRSHSCGPAYTSNEKPSSVTRSTTVATALVASREVRGPPVKVASLNGSPPSGVSTPTTKYLLLAATHVSGVASSRRSPGSRLAKPTLLDDSLSDLNAYASDRRSPTESASVSGKLDGRSTSRKRAPVPATAGDVTRPVTPTR